MTWSEPQGEVLDLTEGRRARIPTTQLALRITADLEELNRRGYSLTLVNENAARDGSLDPAEPLGAATTASTADGAGGSEAETALPYPFCWKQTECAAAGRCMAHINCGD